MLQVDGAGRVGSASPRPVANSARSPGAAARSRGGPRASLARLLPPIPVRGTAPALFELVLIII